MIHILHKFLHLQRLEMNLKMAMMGLMTAVLLSHVSNYRKLHVSADFICTHLHTEYTQ